MSNLSEVLLRGAEQNQDIMEAVRSTLKTMREQGVEVTRDNILQSASITSVGGDKAILLAELILRQDRRERNTFSKDTRKA